MDGRKMDDVAEVLVLLLLVVVVPATMSMIQRSSMMGFDGWMDVPGLLSKLVCFSVLWFQWPFLDA